MTDDAAGEVASVHQRRRRRRLVDTDSDASEASPVQVVRGRRLVIVGAQTQVDPVEPTVPDLESHRTSDTESIKSRSGISDMEGEVEVASVPEPPVPAIVVPVERFNRSFEWLAGVDLEAGSDSALFDEIRSRFHERGLQVSYASCSHRN